MIRVRFAYLGLLISSAAFAGSPCDSSLRLSCQAQYMHEGQTKFTATETAAFSDENWDEPSLTSCASTIYFAIDALPKTSVRVYAKQNLRNKKIVAEAVATQIEDTLTNGQTLRTVEYSDSITATQVRSSLDLGVIRLPKAILVEDTIINEIEVQCSTKK